MPAALRPSALAPGQAEGPTWTEGPALGRWSRAWRYAVVVVAALVLLLIAAEEVLPPEDAPDHVVGPAGALLLLDALLGVAAVCLLALRRQFPRAVAGTTAGLTGASASALSAAVLSAVSLGTRAASLRRAWPSLALVGGVWVAAVLVYELAWRPLVPGQVLADPLTLVGVCLVALVSYGVCVGVGTAVGDRRRLVVSLQERALTAERSQQLEAEVAREAERTRIAREMHDVLAHRISLVALHAGALAYNPDLSREQTAQTAGTIADNAQLAMAELRQVLGVLRAGGTTQGDGPEPPQPTLAELPALVADAEDAGALVRLDTTGLPTSATDDGVAAPSDTVSRTAFRIVQEALTNARKHAPFSPVDLRVAGAPGRGLQLEVRNGTGPVADAGRWGAGVGLVGATERAQLAGGSLRCGEEGDEWVVRADLPWP